MLKKLDNQTLQSLISWYQNNHRPLPWRVSNPNPYHVWLAEVMSQQTQMATLVPYFEKFTQTFPTVHDLAAAKESSVLSLWAGLGYYSRARNLHKAAKLIAENLPKSKSQWEQLPGVGPYTAAAISSQCFGEKVAVWDGNVLRVCARLEGKKDAHTREFQHASLKVLNEKISKFDASLFNQGLMELGATVCTKKKPACHKCPFQIICQAKISSQPESYPATKTRKQNILLSPRAQIWIYKNKVFLHQREKNQWYSGLWDFPSELGGVKQPILKMNVPGERFGAVKHNITHHKIVLNGNVTLVHSLKTAKASVTQYNENSGWFALEDIICEQPVVPLATTAKKLIPPLMRWLEQRNDLR